MMFTESARPHRLGHLTSGVLLVTALSMSSPALGAITQESSYIIQEYGLTSGQSERVEIWDLNSYAQSFTDSGSVIRERYSPECECTITEIYDASVSTTLSFQADLLAGTIEGSGQYTTTNDHPSYNQGWATSAIDYRFSLDEPYYFVLRMTASAGSKASGQFGGASIVDPSLGVYFHLTEEAVDLVRQGILQANPGNTQNTVSITSGGCEAGCIGDPSAAFAFSLRLVPLPEPTHSSALPFAVLAIDWAHRRRRGRRPQSPRAA